MKNKNEVNENKLMLGDFNCRVDKKERNGSNKTLYKFHFSYALSKLIVDKEILWRRKNSDSSELACYNRSSGGRSTIGRVYTDIKMSINIKINHIMVSLTGYDNAISRLT